MGTMKRVISFGAGLDSTALAAEMLRDTDDEIVLLYITEQHEYWGAAQSNIAAREMRCTANIAKWLATNVRPLADVIYVPQKRVLPGLAFQQNGLPDTERSFYYRCREGFRQTTFMYVHWGVNRFITTALAIEQMGDVDEVVTAFNRWDTDNDFLETFWLRAYEALTDVPMRFPYLTIHEDGSYEGIGRFEIQSRVPQELFDLTIQCHTDPPCGECWRCTLNAYYREHCSGKTDEEIRAVDLALERRYCIGRYARNADPETYDMWAKYNL